MKSTTFLLFSSITLAASFAQVSCTYKEEVAEKERYDKITGDSLDTGADPSVPALNKDSFAQKEGEAIKAPSTDNGSTNAAYAADDKGTGSGGASEKK
jgi:hypothetical protein